MSNRLLVILILFGSLLFALPYIDRKAEEKLKELIIKKLYDNSKIRCTISTVDIQWFNRSLKLEKIKIQPADSGAITTGINSISLNELSISGYINDDRLHFGNAVIENIVLDYITDRKGDSTVTEQAERLDWLVDKLEINQVKIRLFKEKDSVAFGKFNIENIQIASFSYTNEVNGELDELLITGLTLRTGNELYDISTDTLNYNYEKQCLEFSNSNVTPTCAAAEFFRRSGTQTDRMVFKSDFSIFLKNPVQLKDTAIDCRLIAFENFNVQALRNKRYPASGKDKKSVQRMIHELPFNFKSDTITVRDGSIKYTEIAENENRSGVIQFTHMDADIHGFTSEKKNSGLKVYAAANFQDESRLHFNLFIPLNTDDVIFNCSGNMAPMKLEVADSVVKNLTPLTIKDGQLDTLYFSFHADNEEAKGTMLFRFHDLRIELQNNENESTNGNKVLSELLHIFKIKEDNNTPGKLNEDVTAIYYKRNPDKFIFNYCWKAILSGILPAVGADNVKI